MLQEKRIGEQVWRALYDPLDSRNVFLALIVPDNKQNGVAPKVKLIDCCTVVNNQKSVGY